MLALATVTVVAIARASGPYLVKDIDPGGSSSPSDLTAVGGTLFFNATDVTNDRELWKSDGTAAGTVLVKDIRPGRDRSGPSYLTDVSGTLFFEAREDITGSELWKSDGTAAGTVLVKDIRPGSDSSSPNNLFNLRGTLFFRRRDRPREGHKAGKQLVEPLVPDRLERHAPLPRE
jgi:ELWxxDGT repeat protein